MMQILLSPVAQTIFSIIAVLCYVACAFRILCFDQLHKQTCSFRLFAAILIGAFLAQSLHIIFIKDPVTIWDAILAVFLVMFIFKSKGNVVLMLGSTRS
ncbi:phage holin family protein [Acinetobacter thermotolerans]|uniref:phage holin family protein n=1 Tax=Acinetobacter thermotolerans TaxID=3151487 RepID=UPI00325A9B45